MYVIIKPQRGEPFTMEVDFSDTVSVVKQKIKNKQLIPVSRQTLVFNGRILPDDRYLFSCNIVQNSGINLIIAEDHASSSSHPLPDNDNDPTVAAALALANVLASSWSLPVLDDDAAAAIASNALARRCSPPGPPLLDNDTVAAAKALASSRAPSLLDEAAAEALASGLSHPLPANANSLSLPLPEYAAATPKGKAMASSSSHPLPKEAAATRKGRARVRRRSAPSNATMRLNVNFPTPKMHVVPTEMDVNGTVRNLKNKILEAERTNRTVTNRSMALRCSTHEELRENSSLREYWISNGADTHVRFGPWSCSLTVHVTSRCRTMRVPVEVSPHDGVAVLRKACEKLNREINFPLPADGYFFILRGAQMEEEKSLFWYNVRDGDNIFLRSSLDK